MKNGKKEGIIADTEIFLFYIFIFHVMHYIQYYLFDTSDYSSDNAYGIPLINKKIPGLMKDENNGAIITEFVGLRIKCMPCV